MCTGESPRNFPSRPHENDTCAVTPCTAIQGQHKCHFSEGPLRAPFKLWAMEFLFIRAKGTRRKMTTRKWHLDSLELGHRIRNPFAPHRGQNPQNREQRDSESRSPFPTTTPEKGGPSQKPPIFLVVPCLEKWGFLDTQRPMGGGGSLLNLLFPILGSWPR